MNRIRLLPEHVANQIAAGEVVERPASVVKELVENALDAGASRITVEIQAGGRSLVRVVDDGFGMSRDDALLSLERHATSKIQRAEDLSAVATMGFRGEALPSIASVSRFLLVTRERDTDSPEGTQIVVNGGRIVEVKAAGSAPGTSVEVRQIFFNLPARRKFLRSEDTESAHVQHFLTLAALAHPEVAFTFLKDGRLVWQLPALKSGEDALSKSEALRERIRVQWGDGLKLLPVDFSGELPPMGESMENEESTGVAPLRIWGFVGAPGVSRGTRENQHLFVNRRPVENRALNFALLEGYHTALMKGRYPVCCLFLELNPAEVDVNIHPSKREVKFHRERAVRHLVTEAIRHVLLEFHAAPAAPRPAAILPATKALDLNLGRNPVLPVSNSPESRSQVERKASVSTSPPANPPANWPSTSGVAPAPTPIRAAEPALRPAGEGWKSEAEGVRVPARSEPSGEPTALLTVPLRLVGVIGKLYVVLESDRGLVLLDQHAAHERILYEQMLRRLEEGGSAMSQRLLLPETVELSARDAHFLREQLSGLTRLGIGLSEFGERTFLLDALPPFVKSTEPRRFILELIDELKAAGQGVNSLRLGEQVISKTVCRHAVKANDPLSGPELENLVRDLRHCSMPYTCPHGRPTLIEMNFRELEKKFGRIQ